MAGGHCSMILKNRPKEAATTASTRSSYAGIIRIRFLGLSRSRMTLSAFRHIQCGAVSSPNRVTLKRFNGSVKHANSHIFSAGTCL